MKDKKVLVTGGTGSFGQTMVRHLLEIGAREIVVLSRDEWKQEDMRIRLNDPSVRFHVGDVRNRASVDAAMRGVNLVFHAAALKQVPSCEFFPAEAVATNILGSTNVIDSAVSHRVEAVVCLGTDKGVYPVNTMGMTKALMEKVVQAAARQLDGSDTILSIVRYGNVLFSRGSVIPLFIRQLRDGGPVTVTDPRMTRFMMPLADSVELVKYALTHSSQGDIFVPKAPATTIQNLLAALQHLLGTDVPSKTIGVRHGEKIHETLASAEELSRADEFERYFRIPMDGRDLNYSLFFSEGDPAIADTIDFSSASAQHLDVDELVALLRSTPEMQRELAPART